MKRPELTPEEEHDIDTLLEFLMKNDFDDDIENAPGILKRQKKPVYINGKYAGDFPQIILDLDLPVEFDFPFKNYWFTLECPGDTLDGDGSVFVRIIYNTEHNRRVMGNVINNWLASLPRNDEGKIVIPGLSVDVVGMSVRLESVRILLPFDSRPNKSKRFHLYHYGPEYFIRSVRNLKRLLDGVRPAEVKKDVVEFVLQIGVGWGTKNYEARLGAFFRAIPRKASRCLGELRNVLNVGQHVSDIKDKRPFRGLYDELLGFRIWLAKEAKE